LSQAFPVHQDLLKNVKVVGKILRFILPTMKHVMNVKKRISIATGVSNPVEVNDILNQD